MADEKKQKEKKQQKSELGGLLGLIVMTLIVVGIIFLNKNPQMVAGVSTKKDVVQATKNVKPEEQISNNVKANVQLDINKIKEQVGNLSSQDLLSSSPQVQKIIKDLQSLPQYPKDQAKVACMKICDGL